MNRMKKIMLTVLVFAFLLVPMLTVTASAKAAKLDAPAKETVYMYSPDSYLFLQLKNTKKDAKYTVTFSKKGILDVESYFRDAKGSWTVLGLWMAKPGKVTVTVKETYKKKTKKIGTVTYTVKKDKRNFYNGAENNKNAAFLKHKVNRAYDGGVSLEVAAMMNLSDSGATFVLDHAPNLYEIAASNGGKIEFLVFDGAGRTARYEGSLQSGSRIVNAGRKIGSYEIKHQVVPGSTYYAATFKRSAKGGAGIMLNTIAK